MTFLQNIYGSNKQKHHSYEKNQGAFIRMTKDL